MTCLNGTGTHPFLRRSNTERKEKIGIVRLWAASDKVPPCSGEGQGTGQLR